MEETLLQSTVYDNLLSLKTQMIIAKWSPNSGLMNIQDWHLKS